MKLEICGAKATQTAVPELGQAEKTLYYLIIGEGDNKVVINVGQKTYEKIEKLTTTTTYTNADLINKPNNKK